MSWVRFTAPFSWDPPERKGLTTLTFPAGAERSVRADCAKAAVKAQAAVRIKTPKRGAPKDAERG